MNRLPDEIIGMIISYLLDPPPEKPSKRPLPPYFHLAPYATISSRWQHPVEALTFRHIVLTPKRLVSPLAAHALKPSRLCRLVRSVHVDLLLRPYDAAAQGRRENETEKEMSDGMFTHAMRRLFSLLSPPGTDAWADPSGGYHPRIHLSLAAPFISEPDELDAMRQFIDIHNAPSEKVFGGRYEGSYLDLRPAEGGSVQDVVNALPELPWVSRFEVEASPRMGYRYFAPRALCLMASKMPRLNSIHWELCDNEKKDVELRKKLRADFASTLHKLPNTLEQFFLAYCRDTPLDHFFEPPSILDESDRGSDKLSVALHKLSQTLTRFCLEAAVGHEILWPRGLKLCHRKHQPKDDTAPHWPKLRSYRINPGPITPSGRWRFQQPPDFSDSNSSSSSSPSSDDDDDGDISISDDGITPGGLFYLYPLDTGSKAPGDEIEDPFREEPDPDAVGAVLLAGGLAAARMPRLSSMVLSMRSGTGVGKGWISFGYAPLSRREGCGGEGPVVAGVGVRSDLRITARRKFYPNGAVMRAWSKVAMEHLGTRSSITVTVEEDRKGSGGWMGIR